MAFHLRDICWAHLLNAHYALWHPSNPISFNCQNKYTYPVFFTFVHKGGNWSSERPGWCPRSQRQSVAELYLRILIPFPEFVWVSFLYWPIQTTEWIRVFLGGNYLHNNLWTYFSPPRTMSGRDPRIPEVQVLLTGPCLPATPSFSSTPILQIRTQKEAGTWLT